MIHLLKYERMRGVAKLLGGFLAESILTLQAEAARELVVVAVPLFRGQAARARLQPGGAAGGCGDRRVAAGARRSGGCGGCEACWRGGATREASSS